MNYLTADPAMLDRLRGIREPVEIRDPNGKVLGRFIPLLSEEEEALHARAQSLFDLAEAERVAAAETHGSPLAEVLQRLQSPEPRG